MVFHWEFCAKRSIFGFRKSAEYLYGRIDILPKQKVCKMKTLQVQVYIQPWLHDKQGATFI